MRNAYVLYNPIAGGGRGLENANRLKERLPEQQLIYRDLTKITDFASFFGGLAPQDEVILCGGDGTLNRFVNATQGLALPKRVLYYATGNGNDFLRDVGKTPADAPFCVNEYLRHLPTVRVNDRQYRFLNGVGYGIDGYCCAVGDKKRESTTRPVNYTAIAIEGLLYGYRPTAASVSVDGVRKTYQKVWIAPTMYGRFYGGGMQPAPAQSRQNPAHSVSLAVIHTAGKLRTLCVFPSIFKGGHVAHTDMVDVFCGRHITVEFDRPAPLQIDGETVLDVTRYEVQAAED